MIISDRQAGRTTEAVHHAVNLATRGRSVAYISASVQQAALAWSIAKKQLNMLGVDYTTASDYCVIINRAGRTVSSMYFVQESNTDRLRGIDKIVVMYDHFLHERAAFEIEALRDDKASLTSQVTELERRNSALHDNLSNSAMHNELLTKQLDLLKMLLNKGVADELERLSKQEG